MTFSEPNVDRFLDCITCEQYEEWIEYFVLEPWGSISDDLRNGILCSTVHNLLSTKARTAQSFMYQGEDAKKPEQSQEEMRLSAMAWAAQCGTLVPYGGSESSGDS